MTDNFHYSEIISNSRYLRDFNLIASAQIRGKNRVGTKKIPDNRLIIRDSLHFALIVRDPLGARTQDPNIKSVVLYLLS